MAEALQKPRGQCTPFAFFVHICNEHIVKKNPDKEVDINQLSDLCWDRWQEMTTKEQKRFVEMSKCDKTRYEKEMSAYEEAKKAQSKEKKEMKKKEAKEKKAEEKKKKKKRDPTAPKMPTSAYFYFANELRAQLKTENSELSITEFAKEAGKRWRELDAESKAKYEKLAAADKERYEREKAEHAAGGVMKSPAKKTGSESPSKQVTPASAASDSSDDSDSD